MMPPATSSPDQPASLPDHKQLPETDGSIVENFQELPQANLLSDSLGPKLRQLYPDGKYAIGADSGIYWRHTPPDPLRGCKAPDWFLVPGVTQMLDGEYRRSYVMWQEGIRPLIVVEFVSGDGNEEHDTTWLTGKFWVYEQGICAPYYAIYDAKKPSIELYTLNKARYETVPANEAGRYPVAPLGVELGLWEGTYRQTTVPWLRVWDSATGKMLLHSEELLEIANKRADSAEELIDDARERLHEETERAENERKRAEEEKKRADDANREKHSLAEDNRKLIEKLRAAGIDPAA